jgi:succinyl-CoA synthetase alpha subunit
MGILINKNTRVITQGITGATGLFHAQGAREYGTQMVGGVTPGKGGTTIDGFPVFDTVKKLSNRPAPPPGHLRPATLCRRLDHGGVDAGIELVCCITEGIQSSTWSRSNIS